MKADNERLIQKHPISYFELLPYDVFDHLVINSKMSATDLLHLCESSDELNEKCYHRDDQLFERVLKLTYGVQELYAPASEVIPFIETKQWDNILKYMLAPSRALMDYEKGGVDLVIPDVYMDVIKNVLGNLYDVFNPMFIVLQYMNNKDSLGAIADLHISTTELPDIDDNGMINGNVKILALLKPYPKAPEHARLLVNGILMDNKMQAKFDDYYKNHLIT